MRRPVIRIVTTSSDSTRTSSTAVRWTSARTAGIRKRKMSSSMATVTNRLVHNSWLSGWPRKSPPIASGCQKAGPVAA